nr:GntR family transcriptional regulator [Shimia biformata]
MRFSCATQWQLLRESVKVAVTKPARISRVDDAYARLKGEILSNRLLPGFQAPEPEFAERLGMSRTPVREALLRLEAEGLVQLVPRRGARILPVLASDMTEIYDLLGALEPHAAAELARRNPSKAELAPLIAATDDMEAALDEGNLEKWAAADDRFHRTLLELHGNRRLIGFASSLYDQAHRARMVTLRMRDKPVRSTREHRDILDLLLSGDAEGVEQLFRDHRRRAASELLNILETFGLPQL